MGAFAAFASAHATQPIDAPYGFPIITSYGSDQIGADPAAFCGRQAPDGTMYIGGMGLLTYDGDRWTLNNISGIDAIYGLDWGKDGRIWAATEGDAGWFSRGESGNWTFHSLRSHIPSDSTIHGQVWDICADGVGAVFITFERVYRWDGKTVQSWTLPGLHTARLFRLHGEICAMDYRNKNLYRISAAGMSRVSPAELGAPEAGWLLWSDDNGNQWIYSTKDGCFAGDGTHVRMLNSATSNLLFEDQATQAMRLKDGRYAFSTKKGIVVTDHDGRLQESIPLPHADGIQRMYVDQEGMLWLFARFSGMARINLQPTRIFDNRSHESKDAFRQIAATGNVVTIAEGATPESLSPDLIHFTPLSLNSDGRVSATRNHGLLLGGYNGAFWVQTQEGLRHITDLPKSAQNAQTAIASQIWPGEFLVSTYDMAIWRVTSGQAISCIVHKLPVVAASLAEDSNNSLWIGTDTDGLLVANVDNHNVVTPVRPAEPWGLPSSVAKGKIYVRRTPTGDILIIGDAGAWVKRSGENIFVPIRDYPQRPFTSVSICLEDGSVWVLHAASDSFAQTVAQISPIGGWHWTPHSIMGLETIGQPFGIAADTDTYGHVVLWLTGSKAVLRHVVENGPIAPEPIAPLLTAYWCGRRGERHMIKGTLPYSTPSVEFEFSEPDFGRRPLIRLETRISGVDSKWIPAGKDSLRDLTAIRDGKYTFEVRAVAETGKISPITAFSFEVTPPWWRSTTALWLEAGALALAMYGGVYWRVRTLRRRNEQLEAKVSARTAELVQANAAKTEFVANMSHNIRNPLNGIVGLTLALKKTSREDERRELLATLHECTTYLSSLVDDVLDFARIEAGRIELHPAPYVPAELLNAVTAALKAECSARGAAISIETDPEVPPLLQGDAGRIQQILVNYVANALKYAGGHIRLSATVSAAAPGEIEYAVTDDGPGICEAEQHKLFTKFSRLGEADHIKGSGLGLASCRLLADAMGGSVGVESQRGRGARFFVRLPLVVASGHTPARKELKLPPASVLLVEDADYNALAAKAVLAELGLTCDRASTGAEALTLFAKKRHRIVLLDRNLPDMDGADVATRIRELECNGQHSVLLAVTAYCTAEDKRLCLDAGMDVFVGKPLTPDKLRRVLLNFAEQLYGAGETRGSIPTIPATDDSAGNVDTLLLEYLADDGGGGVGALVERFSADIDAAHAQLEAAAMGPNLLATADAAHRVLGHSQLVGATRLNELLRALETAARNSDRDVVLATLPRIGPEIAALKEALRRHPAAQKA